MSIINANPCRQRGPTIYTLQSVSDLDWIKQPNVGDIAIMIAMGLSEFWVFEEPYDGEIDGFDAISGGCRGAWVRGSEEINVVAFGAVGDGVTDSTEAVMLAYNILAERGGGVLYFPFARGRYLFNLTVTDDNIVIRGSGVCDVRENSTIGFGPWDTDEYLIQVGNDTDYVDGFGIEGVALFGDKDGVQCQGCLYFAGGSYAGKASNIGMIGGIRTLYFKAGLNFPSTLNSVIAFDLWEGTTSTIEVDDTRLGDPETAFCTGTKLVAGYANGNNFTGHAIKVIKGKINLEGFYLDAKSEHGIYLENNGNISAVNTDLEIENTTNVLVEVAFPDETYSERSIARFIQGGVRMQGAVRWTDENGSVETPLGVVESTSNEEQQRKPRIELPAKLGDVVQTQGIFILDHDSPDLVVSRIDLAPMRFRLGGSNEAYLLVGIDNSANNRLFFDMLEASTVATQCEFFRSTNTVGDSVLIIYKGDGTNSPNTRLSGKTNSYINALAGAVGIGTDSPDASARLDVASNASGFLPPRMTKAQRDAIASPANGLIIYQLDNTAGPRQYVNGAWNSFTITPDP